MNYTIIFAVLVGILLIVVIVDLSKYNEGTLRYISSLLPVLLLSIFSFCLGFSGAP